MISKERVTLSSTVPIQISAWNINGYKSRIVNNKLTDSSFLKEIENDDIVSLVETHNSSIDDQLSILYFSFISSETFSIWSLTSFAVFVSMSFTLRVKVKNRPSNNKKASGGLAYFAKENIFKSIVPINNDNKDVLWIKLKKDIFDKKRDIYIGTVYLTPYKNSNDSSKKKFDLFEEILSFQKKREKL